MLKKFFILLLIIASITLLFLFSFEQSESSLIRNINCSLNLNIPYGDIKYYKNTTGGFHGDGETVEIISLNKEENEDFNQNKDNKWKELDPKSDIYNYLWNSETEPGKKAFGGHLNEKLYPETDTMFILFDYANQKLNEEIELKEMYNFIYVGYSYKKSTIYIQKKDI